MLMKAHNDVSAQSSFIGGCGSGQHSAFGTTPPATQPAPSPALGRAGQTATLLAALFFASAAFAQTPRDFAARADVVVPPGSSIVRAELPAALTAAMRGANGGDLRVFNATGVSVPHALIDASTEAVARADAPGQRVLAMPIYASTTATTAGAPTLRIEDGPNGRVVEYSSTKATATTKQDPRGLLFDTRKIASDVRAVELEGTLPNATIVKVSLDISADLKSWRTLVSDAPVFDFGSDGPSNLRILLPAAQTFKDQYVRLTSDALGGSQIVALKTVGVSAVKAAQPTTITLGAPVISADNAAEWTLATGFRATGLRLQTTANNALMPVRVLTRARAGDPWQPVASTVVFRLAGTSGSDTVNPAVPINATLATQLRVEALRGYSLTGVPLTLALDYPPLQVLFIATGTGPFSIVTGKAGLETAALPVATLMPNYAPGAEFATSLLPASNITVDAKPRTAGQAATDSLSDLFTRSTVLWAVLGLAVAVLAGLAISLLRSPVKR
jgi:Protein of unknown function (DUF3999)